MANVVEIILKANDRTKPGLTQAQRGIAQMRLAVERLKPVMIGLATAAAGAFTLIAKQQIAVADETAKLAKKLGSTTEFLSTFSFAASLAGVSMDGLRNGFKTLAQRALDASRGLKSATDDFDDLGVSVLRADGTLKGTEELIYDVADGLSRMENETQRAAIATRLLGRNGLDLLPLLNDGAESIKGMQQEARELGAEIGGRFAANAEQFNDNLTRLKTITFGLVREAFGPLLEQIVEMGNAFIQAARDGQWFRSVAISIQAVMESTIATAKQVALGFMLVGTAIIELANATGKFATGDLEGARNALEDIGKWAALFASKIKEIDDNLGEADIPERIEPITVEINKAAQAAKDATPEMAALGREFLGLVDDEAGKRLFAFMESLRELQNFSGFNFLTEVGVTAMNNLTNGVTDLVLGLKTAGEFAQELGEALVRAMVQYVVEMTAAFAVHKVLQAAGLALLGTTVATTTAAASGLAGAWAAAATGALIATLGSAASASGLFPPALAANVGLAKSAALVGGIAHGGLDFVPSESTFLLQRGERVIQPSANRDLTAFLSGAGGREMSVNVFLDGVSIARWIGKASRDGRLNINARAIQA